MSQLSFRRFSFIGIFLFACLPIHANAKVIASSENHFIIENEVEVPLDLQASYRLLGKPSQWWNPDHTWSGNAKHMRLPLKAGACFCEVWNGNSVMHAQVILAQPPSVLRLQGALGPLQDMAVIAVLTYKLEKTENGTRVKMIYRVSGDPGHKLTSLNQIVDKVLGEQLERFGKKASQ